MYVEDSDDVTEADHFVSADVYKHTSHLPSILLLYQSARETNAFALPAYRETVTDLSS